MLELAEMRALIERCAPNVAHPTLLGIAEVESGFDPLAIGVNGPPHRQVRSANAPDAIAAAKAREAAESHGWTQPRTVGSAVASDAFFPFADGLLAAVEAGATCVIQPGGSIRDDEVIAAANAAGLAMVFTGMRHFRH